MRDEADEQERNLAKKTDSSREEWVKTKMASTLMCNLSPKTWEETYVDMSMAAVVKEARGSLKFTDGHTRKFSYEFRDTYKDEYTGDVLPEAHIRAAIVDELSYFNNVVWTACSMAEAHQTPDAILAVTGPGGNSFSKLLLCTLYSPVRKSLRV